MEALGIFTQQYLINFTQFKTEFYTIITDKLLKSLFPSFSNAASTFSISNRLGFLEF